MMEKTRRNFTLLISIGLLLDTVPLLLKEYFFIPDFFRGLCCGLGLGLMIIALVLYKKVARIKKTSKGEYGSSVE